MTTLSPFHLAIPVSDLEQTCAFYERILGCVRGRESENWVDLDFMGHQVVLHRAADRPVTGAEPRPVDGEQVPVPHFGVVLDWEVFAALAERLVEKGVDFLISPTTRFEGRTGEQRTCFLRDPSGNHLEFKTFKDPSMLFSTDLQSYE